MKTKYLKRILPIIMSSSIGLSGCATNDEYVEDQTYTFDYLETVDDEISKSESELKLNEREIGLDYETVSIATTKGEVNVRVEPNSECEIEGVLPINTIVDVIQKIDDWYEINYNGELGYVYADYINEEISYLVKNNIIKMAYLKEDTMVYDKDFNELGIAPMYETVEVYKEDENNYYAVIGDKLGYVDKTKTVELTDTFVTVDISRQMLNLYKDGKLDYVTPVVTGKPINGVSRTPVGIYEIFDTRGHRELVGPDYRAYVDYMMKFNGDIGLHDAEYHVDYDEDGNIIKKHGWKNIEDFGGNNYVLHGSHGCVNMLNEAAKYVNENVEIGTKVLVKK